MKESKLIAVKLVPSMLPVSLPTERSWIFQNKLPVVFTGIEARLPDKISGL